MLEHKREYPNVHVAVYVTKTNVTLFALRTILMEQAATCHYSSLSKCEGNLGRSLGNYTPHSILLELTNLPAFTYHNSQSDGANVADPVVTKVYADADPY